MRFIENIMRWFRRREVEADTDRQVREVQQHSADVGAHVERSLAENDERVEQIKRRARVKFHEYDSSAHGHVDRRSGNGGHAAGGA